MLWASGRLRAPTALSVLVVLAACADMSDEHAPVLSYENAFIMVPIAGRDVTMGGVTLQVDGGDARLVGASSDAFDAVEFHTMNMRDGQMQMRKVDAFTLEDGVPLSLDRGGDHLMLFGASPGLDPGGTVGIMLSFEMESGEQTLIVEAEIRGLDD